VDCPLGAPAEMISSVARTDKPSLTILAANFSIAVASLKPSSARACPADKTPDANFVEQMLVDSLNELCLKSVDVNAQVFAQAHRVCS
jgi:hypothetical protein